jgi:hypothetical protein
MKPLKKSTMWQLISRVVLLFLVVTPTSIKANAQTVTLGEALDNTSLTWTTGGDAGWFGQTSEYYYDGDAAQSGNVGDDQSSWIETTITGPGTVTFYWKASGLYSFLQLFVDGEDKARCDSKEWEQESISISSGSHTFRWVWEPPWGGEAGFLDKVEFAPAETVPLGEAVDNTTLTWTTSGDAPWYGQTSEYYYDGDAAQSGGARPGETSWIETTTTGPGILMFYWKASWGYTALKLYVDDTRKMMCDSLEWRQKTIAISSGSHTLRWTWRPSLSDTAGFLDKVEYVPGLAILVSSPNGGEVWNHRTRHTITWISPEDVGPVRIELFREGSLSHTVTDSTDNDGAYAWFVPTALEPGTDYLVKVTSISDSSLYDYSDSNFSINEYQSSFGGLFALESSNDYAETADHSELDVGDEDGESLTIEAWVYIQGSGTQSEFLSVVDKSSYQGYSLYARRYYYPSAGGTVGCIGTWPAGIEVCEWPPYEVGWHHVAVVYDTENDEMRLYLDGEALLDPHPFTSTIPNSGEALRVGGGALPGAVDEIRISDIARYAGSTCITPTLPLTCDDHTRALWHFDENEGATTFHDACGTDNALIRYNGAQTLQVYLPIVVR